MEGLAGSVTKSSLSQVAKKCVCIAGQPILRDATTAWAKEKVGELGISMVRCRLACTILTTRSMRAKLARPVHVQYGFPLKQPHCCRYFSMTAAALILFVGVPSRPDSSLVTWAHKEAQKRLKAQEG